MSASAGPRPTIRQRLRNATSGAHARLDAHFAHFDLQSLTGYRRFLEASAMALLPLECTLIEAGVNRIFPDWAKRSRRQAILTDLATLDGRIDPAVALSVLDLGGVLGTMYVLEGSRLGAAMLLKTITLSPDPRVAGTTAYLGHGAGQHLWASFLTMLEAHAASLRDDRSAVSAALQAFDLFEQAARRACHSEARLHPGYALA